MRGLFITGTDTGIGKTFFTLAAIHALQQKGIKTTAMKPVASGAELIQGQLRNEDALAMQQAIDHAVPYERINPYCFSPPVSPHLAAAQAQTRIDLEVIKMNYHKLIEDEQFVLVEGVGGWLTPLSETAAVADLAKVFNLPVVLVVGMRLGCLNHALLTAQAIERCGFRLAGWVANSIDPDCVFIQEQIDYLASHLGSLPILNIPYRSQVNAFGIGLAERLLSLSA